ncbi:MAG: hypothetical protein V2B18_06760 [Pseudomonadota bacterium]
MGMMGNPNFAKWFGKSVVKDAKGEPLRVFHGGRKFNEFDVSAPSSTMNRPQSEFWFTSSKDNANFYADGQVKAGYLKMENPKVFTADDLKGKRPKDLVDSAVMDNYRNDTGWDGVIIKDVRDGSHFSDIYAVMPDDAGTTTQFKSVRNRGTFDPTDPNILKSVGAGLGLMGAASAISPERANAEALQEPTFDPTTLLAGPTRWGGGLMNMGVDAAMRYFTGGK